MKNKSLVLTLLIVSFSFIAFSQKHFVPGYVVLNSHDTIRGLIDDEEWSINPTSIRFKKPSNETISIYTPLTIQSFKIENGNWYFSFSDSVESSSLHTSELSEMKSPEKRKDTVFVRALMIGKASLFYLNDRHEREHFLFQNSDGNITELYYKKYKVISDQGTFMGEILTYKAQLIQLISSCPGLAATVTSRSLRYSEKDLSAFFKDYNDCKGSPVIYTEPKEKWKYKATIEVGVNISKLSFYSNSSFVNGWVFGYEVGYVAGAGFDAIIPRNRGKWSINNEVLVRNFKSSQTGLNHDVAYNLIYLNLALTIRYHFINGKVQPFIEFGMTNAIALKAVHDSYSIFNSFRKYEQGLVAGFGIPYKTFSFEPMLELSNGMSPFPSIRSTFATWYIQFGYIF